MVTENAGSGKGSIDEKVEVDELLEAKRHIYFLTPNEYRGLTGRSLDDVEFVTLTSTGLPPCVTDNYLQEGIHLALLDMYRQMKAQGIEFALGFSYTQIEQWIKKENRYNRWTIFAYANGVKRKPKEGDL